MSNIAYICMTIVACLLIVCETIIRIIKLNKNNKEVRVWKI
jgi:hypothetical protein